MVKLVRYLYHFECYLFKKVNQYFDRKFLNFYFRIITHFGGAVLTITSVIALIFMTNGNPKTISYASAVALALSHVPVALIKKLYPRKRPYLQLPGTKVLKNPLQDHSFPSGHTTAIFSITTPFIIYSPLLMIVLLPFAFSVGISRIYLGLHYPTDVLAGIILGFSFGFFSFIILQ